MKYIKSFAASLVVAGSLMMASCDPSDFGDINETPNNPTKSFTYMLFKYSSTYVRNFIMTSSSYDPWPAEWSGYLAEAKNNQYGPLTVTNAFSASNYYTAAIRGLNSIIEANQDEAQKGTTAVTSFGSNSNQIGVCMTLRSFYFMSLTDILGPISYSEAYKVTGEDAVWEPKYDSQAEVYAQLDRDLQEGFNYLNTSESLSSTHDIFYHGDVAKWKKLNATLRMCLAIKMADVDPANGKTRFAKAFADGGMTDAADSFTWTFTTNSNSWFYAIGNETLGGSRSNYFAPNKIFVDALKEYKDPRLFTYTTIGVGLDGKAKFAYLGNIDKDPADFNSYDGVPHGLASNDMVDRAIKGKCSVAPKYCDPLATYGLITAARSLLIAAEAAQRGWISAKAADLYAQGIKASFDFEAMSDKAFDASKAEDYIAAHPLPQDNDAAMKEIVMQRFLAGFLTDGVEAWADWRRFNIPEFPIYQGQRDAGHTTYPNRLMFGDSDYSANKENVVAALKDLSNGVDDPWSRVWWDVADNVCPQIEWEDK